MSTADQNWSSWSHNIDGCLLEWTNAIITDHILRPSVISTGEAGYTHHLSTIRWTPASNRGQSATIAINKPW